MLDEILNFDRTVLKELGYKINDRTLENVMPFFSEDYKKISLGLEYRTSDVIYSGAEHTGNPKLPNITLLPNLIENRNVILGSTFGHQHTKILGDTRHFQEIYEFLGYGGMLIRNKFGTTLHILNPGEKVIVTNTDNMTILNLQEKPLITLDYANPSRNLANKDLEKEIGTIIVARSNDFDTTFKINDSYYNRRILNPEKNKSLITINRPITSKDFVGKLKLEDYSLDFKEAGIDISFGSNIPYYLRDEFSRPLLDLVLDKNETLFRSLGMEEIR